VAAERQWRVVEMAMMPQEQVYWTNGEVWVTDSRVVFVDKHFMLDRIKAVTTEIVSLKKRLLYSIPLLLILAIVMIIEWIVSHNEAYLGQSDFMSSFSDYVYATLVMITVILCIGLLLYLRIAPKENIFTIALHKQYVKRIVFVSTNRAYVEQVTEEIRKALIKRAQVAPARPSKVPATLPIPSYSAAQRVEENPNRVFLDSE
jgi:hypothetical protein